MVAMQKLAASRSAFIDELRKGEKTCPKEKTFTAPRELTAASRFGVGRS
jgi:hypothetical protein